MARRAQPSTSAKPTRTSGRRGAVALRLATKEGPPSITWVGQRWWRYVEGRAEPHDIAEGLTRARQSVVRWLEVKPGEVLAQAQGRGEPRREVRLRFATLSHDEWERAVASMSEQALLVAKALSGDLPTNVEDCFAPLDLRLFPASDDDVRAEVEGRSPQTGAARAAPVRLAGAPNMQPPGSPGPGAAPIPAPPARGVQARWNADVCCVAALLAERLDRDPMLVFTLRGLPEDELNERLRQRRAAAGASASGAPAYAPRPIAAAESLAQPLESALADFWSPGAGLDEFETPLDPPPVKHALLRRLGPSPFKGAKFPLVGLLATCYDTISAAARRNVDAEAESAEADEASGCSSPG